MKKIFSFFIILSIICSNFTYVLALEPINSVSNSIIPVSNLSVDILKDWITQSNAWVIMQQKVFTNGNLDFSNLKFTIVNWAKLELNSNIKQSFEIASKTRTKYNLAKTNASFKALAKYEDKIIEYPDRVRIISKTEYSYNNKSEYDAIFSWSLDSETINPSKIQDFIAENPKFNKYSNGIPKANKKEILEQLTQKIYNQCLSQNKNNITRCKKDTIKVTVENLLNNYKWKRTLTETIDVNKIPLIYDADKNIDFTQRLIDSNISKEPSEVRFSSLQIKNAFLQYSQLSPISWIWNIAQNSKIPANKTCDWLNWIDKTNCEAELAKLNANNQWTNQTIYYDGTLLNGFTLWESYSYKLWDSYSIAWFTVYDIWVSFYAWYWVGIRIPIDVNVSLNKDRLEKWESEDFNITIKADTKDKDINWFKNALWENKAFDWKEAVLEAGAYARWKIVLFDKTVFNEQIWGKADWWSDRKIPVWWEELEIFSWTVKWEQVWLELVLYWVHISWDLMATWKIKWDITYECRSVYSNWIDGDASYCKDIFNTSLKDEDVNDIKMNKNWDLGLISKLNLNANPDKFYYKNALGVYNPYGVSLKNFKYKPELNVDLFLRWKVWVDTWDYFGRFWLETPWLEVYTFDIDLPALKAHDNYNVKKIDIYEKNYIYNFFQDSQDTNTAIDSSVSCTNYAILDEKNHLVWSNKFNIPNSSSNTFLTSDYPKFYNYNYWWNIFYKNDWTLVYEDSYRFWDSGNAYKNYYHIKSTSKIPNSSDYKYWYTRETENYLIDDYKVDKISEMQFVNNNIVYYYSQATNALFTWDINERKIVYNPVPEIKNVTKYANLKSNKKPLKNEFKDMFGFEDDYENITNHYGAYKFKKFDFAFSNDFASNKLFAYIAKNNDTGKLSIQVYKNGVWYKEINEENLEYNSINPVYIQLIGSDLLVVSEDINNSDGSKEYVLYEYNYQDSLNPFVLEGSLDKKKFNFSNNQISTWFSYDKSNKTIFVSYLEKTSWAKMTPKIKSIRFNWNDNSVYEKEIYTTSLTKEQYVSKYSITNYDLDNISNWQEAQSYITNIQLWKDSNSLIISLNHSFLYDNWSKKHYVIDEIKELQFNASEWQKDENWACIQDIPRPTTMNVWIWNTENEEQTNNWESNLSLLFSKDEYVNEKLKEINNCFVDSFSWQLANINSAIDKLNIEKEKQESDLLSAKYDKAIKKMEEIKKLFIARYKTIIELNNN